MPGPRHVGPAQRGAVTDRLWARLRCAMKRAPKLSAEGWVVKKPRSAAKWLGRGGAPAQQRFERCVVAVPPAAGWGRGTQLTVGAEQRAQLLSGAPGRVRLPKGEVAREP